MQPHYNLVHRDEFERELAAVCKTYHLGVIPYSPLAGGFLTGKYRRNLVPISARAGGAKRYFNERNWVLLDQMDALAKEKAASTSQIALAWLMADPLITSPIIGANSLEQLKDNLGALDVQLTLAEKSILDKASSWKEILE
jgi:aryl-alcohol dehydrogenase-like predicted oxidoreductase